MVMISLNEFSFCFVYYRAHHLKVVDKLCHFLQNISTGEYTAYELMIKHWVNTKDIDAQIINVMFERFTMKLPNTTSNISRCCMELLILVSKYVFSYTNNIIKIFQKIIIFAVPNQPLLSAI